jgi:hypothetical protein
MSANSCQFSKSNTLSLSDIIAICVSLPISIPALIIALAAFSLQLIAWRRHRDEGAGTRPRTGDGVEAGAESRAGTGAAITSGSGSRSGLGADSIEPTSIGQNSQENADHLGKDKAS